MRKYIEFIKPSKYKLVLFIALLVAGLFLGIMTFSAFEGSVREGYINLVERIERKFVRPITVGPFLFVDDAFGNEYIAAIVLILYYYLIACALWKFIRFLRRYLSC